MAEKDMAAGRVSTAARRAAAADQDARRNMSGMRSIWNSVSEVKMTAGSSVWPESEHVVNESTDARTGLEWP
jgi:hypothetical protein